MIEPDSRRVVVTGLGILSSIGTTLDEVEANLRIGKSGIRFDPEFKKRNLKCQVVSKVEEDFSKMIPRAYRRSMTQVSINTCVATQRAVADAGLELDDLKRDEVGAIVGSGGTAPETTYLIAEDVAKHNEPKRAGAFAIAKTMGSSVAANLSVMFGTRGVSYSISSACSTSAHCVGEGAEMIRRGWVDTVLAGGGEEITWVNAAMFDAMQALTFEGNDDPENASRVFDADRSGFVPGGGAAMLVLESLERAKERGARIYGEVTGYFSGSDGSHMFAPSGEGSTRTMIGALKRSKVMPTYVNAHATATPAGDSTEMLAIKAAYDALGLPYPKVSSTKSLIGHLLGAAGAAESVCSLLMMHKGFIGPSRTFRTLDPVIAATGVEVVSTPTNEELTSVMSNSFGFGGINCCLVFEKLT